MDFFKIKNFSLKDNENTDYLQMMCTIKKFYAEYIKNSQNSTIRKPNLKMVKRSKYFPDVIWIAVVYEKNVQVHIETSVNVYDTFFRLAKTT